MIATMAMNTPGPSEHSRTTLIVVPAALLYQVSLHIMRLHAFFDLLVHVVEGRTRIQDERDFHCAYPSRQD